MLGIDTFENIHAGAKRAAGASPSFRWTSSVDQLTRTYRVRTWLAFWSRLFGRLWP
jgi:hypothetical protein